MSSVFGGDWADGPVKVTRLGHHGPAVFVVVIGTMATLALVPLSYPAGTKPLISLAFLALMLVTWVEMRKHDRGLCERCVADFPLNPAQDAERYAARLSTVHLLAERRAAAYYLVGVLVACLLPLFVPDALRLPAMALWLVALASLVFLVVSGQTHRKLQPWCPQCGPQGGTDTIETPEPTPLDSMS